MEKYVIGVDFGTSSVRCIVCDAGSGDVAARAAANYPRWERGLYCSPEREVYRQHPLDYLEALEAAVNECTASLSAKQRAQIVGIGFDTTGSTPAPVDENGRPLALLEEFRDEPSAMFYLWKDHSAAAEAEELNAAFSGGEIDYTLYQGQYSSEWFWAKILNCARTAPQVSEKAMTFVEHCDWIVSELCGGRRPGDILRSACAAGHKALFSADWAGLPSRELLGSMHPLLAKTALNYRLGPVVAGTRAGALSAAWAKSLGLPQGTAVAVGSLDSHAGAVGAGIREGVMVSSFGTSSVDMLISRGGAKRPSFTHCGGAARDSIIPGYMGIESGQAAFGDAFEWLRSFLMWPLRNLSPDAALQARMEGLLIQELSARAEKRPLESKVYALDWLNGRRYPYPDEAAAAVIGGLSLSADPVDVFAALAQANVFGLRRIADSFLSCGFTIERLIATGGIALRSPYIMGLAANCLGMRVDVPQSEETTALGAAIYAAAAAGIYSGVEEAQANMCSAGHKTYYPDAETSAAAERMYQRYLKACDIQIK